MIDYIEETFHRLIDELKAPKQRYLYSLFNLKDRMTGLIGPRGVGKTTLLLQYIKNELYAEGKVFYFSADMVYFDSMNLFEFVADLYNDGGYRIIFIDEIHKYSNWNQELKNLYDSFPQLRIVFSGSSMLDLIRGSHDLSRRVALHHLRGLSFREYLNFNSDDRWKTVAWEEIVKGTVSSQLLSIEKLGPTFRNYLEMGYYPFVSENPLTYYDKLRRVISKTIYEDIANYYKLKTPNLEYFRKILGYLSGIPPGDVSTYNLGKHLGIDHKTVSHYLQILDDVGLVRMVFPDKGGAASIRKPAKVFLHNTTLLHALTNFTGGQAVKGMERELFFLQSITDESRKVFHSKIGDFIADQIIFEIGGKKKTSLQIREAKQPAYLVKDGIRVPYGNERPLHYFGFLY